MPVASVGLLGVPIDSSGNAGKCDRSPVVLRRLGASHAIGVVRDYNDLSVRIDDPVRDKATGVKGAYSVLEANIATKRAVEMMLRDGLKPVLLGGCCSFLLGALAAARRVFGRIGLVYVDGHMDLYDGRTSPSGECADMPLALAVGRGPNFMDDAMETSELVAVRDVSLIGDRDRYLAEPNSSLLPEELGPGLHHRDANSVRAFGFARTAEEVLNVQGSRAGRYWLHLDWDVLDEASFPSADYLMPGGFVWEELVELMRPLVQAPTMVGLSTACYNPDNDPNLQDGKRIIEALRRMFA